MRKHPRWQLGNYLRQFPSIRGTAKSFRRPFGKQDIVRDDFFTSTAPILSSASASASSHIAYTGAVTTDEANGTLYYYISTNSTETGATVKASGATQAVTATGVQNVSGGGLSPATGYYLHFLHRDAANNDSAVLSTSQFFTPSQLFFRNTQANGITSGGVACYDLLTTQGSAPDTAVVNATASGTDIQWTKTAGGSILVFATGRVPIGGWTITKADLAAWFKESVATVNAGARVRFYKWSSGTETLIVGSPFDDGVEFTTSDAEYTWLADVTDTALAEDDRLIVKLYLTNVGTMGTGTATFNFNAAVVAGTGTPNNGFNDADHTVNSFAVTFAADTDYIAIPVQWQHFATCPAISTVTVDGVSATAVAGTDTGNLSLGVNYRAQGWELVDPSGAGVTLGSSVTVTVTFASTTADSQAVARGYKEVNQTTPSEGGFQTGAVAPSGGTKTCAPTTTTVAGDYLIGSYVNFGSSAADVGTVDTQVAENWESNNGTIFNCAESAIAGSGETLGWTDTGSFNWAANIWAIKAASVTTYNSFINVYPAVTFKAEGGGGGGDVIYGLLQQIEQGIIAQTAAGLGGILQE